MLTPSVVLPDGTTGTPVPAPAGGTQPVAPGPVTDGGEDRLVVVAHVLTTDRPSATLLAAKQLSDEAGRDRRRVRGPAASSADRRLRRQRALVAERRAGLAGTSGG